MNVDVLNDWGQQTLKHVYFDAVRSTKLSKFSDDSVKLTIFVPCSGSRRISLDQWVDCNKEVINSLYYTCLGIGPFSAAPWACLLNEPSVSLKPLVHTGLTINQALAAATKDHWWTHVTLTNTALKCFPQHLSEAHGNW